MCSTCERGVISWCDETKDSQLYILAVETLACRQCQYPVASRRVLERAKHEILSPQIFAVIILNMYVAVRYLRPSLLGRGGCNQLNMAFPWRHTALPLLPSVQPHPALFSAWMYVPSCSSVVFVCHPLPACRRPPPPATRLLVFFPVRGSYHHAGILNPPTGVDCSISATANGAKAHRETTPPERETKRQGTAEVNFAMRVSERAATAALCLAGAGGAAGFQSPWVVGRASSVAGAGAGVEQQRPRGAAVAPVPSAR